MKRALSIVLCLAMIFCSVVMFASCGNKTYEIAIVTDVGQLKDGGFNEGTYNGAKNYAEKNNITYQYYQPANGANATDNDRIAAMRQAVKNGAKIIIAPGFLQAKAMETVAKESPEVKFVFIDGWALGLDNVTAVVYKEEESGYMAGYAAVIDGYTKLGGTFGGGGTNPACNRFGFGFVQGAAAAASELATDIEIKYSYMYGSEFGSSPELQTQIAGWYAAGTQVVFSCGGSMVQSVKSAAEETTNGKIIGVDVDQASLSDRVITSAVKGLSVSVEKILTQFYAGEWDAKLANKTSNLGAADDATGISFDTSRFQKFTKAQYEALFAKVKAGEVSISSEVPENCNDAAWLTAAVADNAHVTIVFDK